MSVVKIRIINWMIGVTRMDRVIISEFTKYDLKLIKITKSNVKIYINLKKT